METPGLLTPGLLGEVVSWDMSQSLIAYADVIAALRTASLPPDAAPELSPRSAFSRACKELKENRQIDKVSVDKDTREAKFQLTRVDEISGELCFKRETFTFLNLDTGVIRCDDAEIEQQARKLFADALGVRTSSDVTKIVQTYFRANGDLFPLNRKGVAYFVPARFAEFTGKIESFFTALGGTMGRFPVPKGTQIGNQSVRDAVDAGLATMAAELSAAVDGWDASTRESTMKKAVERWQAIAFKVDAYGEYLESSQSKLKETLDSAKSALAAKITAVGELKETAKAEKAAEKDSGARSLFPATARSAEDTMKEFGDKVVEFDAQHPDIADEVLRVAEAAGVEEFPDF